MKNTIKLSYAILSIMLLSFNEVTTPMWAVLLIVANLILSFYFMRNFPFENLIKRIDNFFK